MTERLKETFKDLQMTKDELDRLAEAMKKEEFRKLLVDYAEEISDPKNRQLYEDEITKLEQERGSDVIFIHPEPGYCIKTTQDGSKKCFINICKNVNIEKPTSQRREHPSSKNSGLMWHIPHTCSQPRTDVDKTGQAECVVYDIVYHPDAYRMGETNQRFNQLLKDSAFDTVESNFGVKLDKVNAKVLKNLNFKGRPTASVIRKPKASAAASTMHSFESVSKEPAKLGENDNANPMGTIIDQLKGEYLNSQMNKEPLAATAKNNTKKLIEQVEKDVTNISDDFSDSKYTVPCYKIVHRGQADMQDFSHQIDHTIVSSTRPKELVVSIELPLCKSSGDLILDLFEKRLYLESNEPNYKLDLTLPYPVNEKEGRAKFDKSKRVLNVTLPVVVFVAKAELNGTESKLLQEDKSFSPSSSSANSLNEDNGEDSVIGFKPPSVKFNLPLKTYVSEFKTSLSLKFKIPSYDAESVRFRFLKADRGCLAKLNSESTSKSSGYTQYYEAFLSFEATDALTYDVKIDEDFSFRNNFSKHVRLVRVNEDFLDIKVRKRDDVSVKNAHVSLTNENDTSKWQKIQVNLESADSADTEWIDDEGSVLVDKSNCNVKDLNKMSRKDYILNFTNMINKEEEDSDEEEEEDDDDEEKENMKNKTAKFEKLKQAEKKKFAKSQKVKTTESTIASSVLLNTEIHVQERIYEEDAELSTANANASDAFMSEENDEEEDNLSETEKEYFRHQKKGTVARIDENNNSSVSLSSSANDSSTFGSSFNGSSTFCKLKSILKKPRSVSESEGSLVSSGFQPANKQDSLPSMSNLSRSSFESQSNSGGSSGSAGTGDEGNQKKCVSFNNQVIRNTFKTGSTVAGMRKPGHSSKKKNKRKRTVSDPSHDSGADALDLKESHAANGDDGAFRARSVSESSDDGGSAGPAYSMESIDKNDENKNTIDRDAAAAGIAVKQQQQKNIGEKKSSKKKKKNNKNGKVEVNEPKKEEDNPFTVETMLEWKNQGRLSCENERGGTKCAFKFKNKIINQLD